MAGYLPGTASQLSFGRVNQAFTSNAPGAAGNAPSGGQNIKLSAVLGSQSVYTVNQSTGTQISFTVTFGGKYYPGTY